MGESRARGQSVHQRQEAGIRPDRLVPSAPVTVASPLHPPTFLATKLDGFPNQLTPAESHLCLLDVGYLINTSCMPLLRPTRDVDLILSLDYNLHGAFQVGWGRLGRQWAAPAWPEPT